MNLKEKTTLGAVEYDKVTMAIEHHVSGLDSSAA